ncbi:MAG: hypothetical protein QXR48_01305 [Candidatus Woesearchaeota archaeon]
MTTPAFSTITKSWHSFISNKKLILFAVLVDLIFVIALTQLHYEVFSKASEHAVRLTTMIGEQAKIIAETENVTDMTLLNSPEFMTEYNQLLKYIGLFVLGALLAWLVCKGILWFIAHNVAEKKQHSGWFVLNFAGITTLWFIGLIIITVISLNLLDYATTTVFPLIGIKMANIITMLLFWALTYFVYVSYALVPHKVFTQTFIIGTKQWKQLLPVHLLSTIITLIAILTPSLLMKTNPYLPLVFGILFSLPALAWTRVLWVTAVHGVIEHG